MLTLICVCYFLLFFLLFPTRTYLILGRDAEAAPGYMAIGPSSVVLEWKEEWSLRMKRFQRRARKCS